MQEIFQESLTALKMLHYWIFDGLTRVTELFFYLMRNKTSLNLGFSFQDAIINYKQKHYENRAANQFFEPYMVRNSTFFLCLLERIGQITYSHFLYMILLSRLNEKSNITP